MAVLVRMVLEKISLTFIINYNGEARKSKVLYFSVSSLMEPHGQSPWSSA
jgi:hypothetical protein